MEITGQQVLSYCKSLSPRSRVRIGLAATLLGATEFFVFAALGDRALALLIAPICGIAFALTLFLRNGSSRSNRLVPIVPSISPRTRRWLNSIPERAVPEKRLLVFAVAALIVPVIACWVLGLLALANDASFWSVAAGLAALGFIWVALAFRPRLRYPKLRTVK